MHRVAFTLISEKLNSTALAKELDQWNEANKLCHHTLQSTSFNELFNVYCSYKEANDIQDSLVLKYTIEDVVKQWFIIENYCRWTMIEDKDIKVQINKYHKLLEDLKA